MANITKTLNTKIKLRYDLYSNWSTNNPVLLAGEVALAYIPTDSSVAVGNSAVEGTTPPQVLIKVGDGTNHYNDLKYVSALAADVLTACKSEEGLTAFINGVIADAGIATNDAMEALAGRVTTAEGEITKLKGTGDGSVAKAIADAIAALDLANTYEAKGEAAKVQGALDSYKTEVTNALADKVAKETGKSLVSDSEITKLTGVSEGANKVEASENNGKIKIDGVETVVYTHPTNHTISEVTGLQDALDGKQAVGDYATKAEAQGYADAKDGAIAEAKAAGTTAQANLEAYQSSNNTALAGVKATAEQGVADAAAVAGDLADHIAEAEGKFETKDDASAKLTEANGYTDTEVAKVQGEVDALETFVGVIPEGYTEENIVAYINKKAEETLASATGDSDESVASVSKALEDYKTENDAKVQANTDAIDAIEADYLKAADKTELEGKITANANAIELLTNGVSAEEVDGVNDLIQYVKDHGTEVTGMKADIKANADAIAEHEEIAAETYETKADASLMENGLVAYVDSLDFQMDTRVKVLEAIDHEAYKAYADQAEADAKAYADGLAGNYDAKGAADAALEAAKAYADANDNDTTYTAATNGGLKLEGTEFSIDDSIVFVFDCGDAEVAE
jgi:hypothetical protein